MRSASGESNPKRTRTTREETKPSFPASAPASSAPNSSSLSTTTTSAPSSGQNCCICFTGEYSFQGVLNCCKHEFCFECIRQWSQINPTCPLCKQNILTISKINTLTQNIEFILPCEVPHDDEDDYDDDDDEDDDDEFNFVDSDGDFFNPLWLLGISVELGSDDENPFWDDEDDDDDDDDDNDDEGWFFNVEEEEEDENIGTIDAPIDLVDSDSDSD